MKTHDYAPPQLASSDETPWIESKAGGLFFVNALLAAPILLTLYPVALRWLLRITGVLDRPSRVLDPVPAVAVHFMPVLGWLALPALYLVWKNFQNIDRPWAKRALGIFLLVHLGTLAFTVSLVL